jgi:RNA polymerase sigma-70 factor (ECF subfamily)
VAGDPAAFGELFARHRDRLWAVALRTLHDPDDAADALQEAMISAFRRAASFRGDAAVTTWLHRIVVNTCLDLLRRKATRPAVPSGDDAVLDALGQRAGGPTPDPASSRDTALDVEAALRILPAEQRAALVLVDMMGYSVAIAAEVLGVAPGTVKSRCARGRAKLLPHLAHLRAARPAGGPPGNQMRTSDVPSAPAAASTAALTGPARQANTEYPAGATDRRPTEEGGNTGRDQAP